MQKQLNIFRLSLNNIRRRFGIYILLMSAVAVGTAIIVFLVIFSEGLEKTARNNLMLLPLNRVWLKPGQVPDKQGGARTVPITSEIVDELENDPDVTSLWPQVDYGGASIIELQIKVLVYSQSFQSVVEVYGVRDDLVQDDLFPGASFKYEEGKPIPVILPESVVRMLNSNMSHQYLPEGKSFPLEVVRTFTSYVSIAVDPKKKKSESFKSFQCTPAGVSMNIPQIGVALPLSVVKEWNRLYGSASHEGSYSRILIESRDAEKASLLAASLEKKGFSIESSRNVYEHIKKIFLGVRSGILVLGLLIIFSVGIGLFNGLNLVVYSERDIIGVMRAVGAKRRNIMEIILLQGIWVGLTGGIAGTLIAFTAAFGLEGFLKEMLQGYNIKAEVLFTFSTAVLVSGCLIPGAACVLFGIIPGIRAISVKPAEVLK